MCEVQDSIFQPSGLRPFFARLAKSRVDSGLALHSRLDERILLATGSCLASRTAVFYTTDLVCALIAQIIPVHLVAGHHLGHHVLVEHVAVSQGVRGL
jgi:Ni,Fe-hydrogenase III small subunit